MDPFLADAVSILRTGLDVMASGAQPTEMVILTGVEGQIQLLAECDWPLDVIRRERGAASAYRITSRRWTVVVEGSQHGRTCRLEQSIATLATHSLPFRFSPNLLFAPPGSGREVLQICG